MSEWFKLTLVYNLLQKYLRIQNQNTMVIDLVYLQVIVYLNHITKGKILISYLKNK